MRFVCDSCRAQYMISDDKVGENGVKVRCKKCGNVIVVRRPQDAEADAALQGLEESAPPPPAPEAPTGENSIFSDVDDAEIGAAFESALGERHDDEPVGQPSAEEPAPVEANLPPVSDGPPRALDWYVAIDDKQTGPLTPEAIKDHWDRGEIGPDSLTWRQGFEDWVPAVRGRRAGGVARAAAAAAGLLAGVVTLGSDARRVGPGRVRVQRRWGDAHGAGRGADAGAGDHGRLEALGLGCAGQPGEGRDRSAQQA